jgi:iron uptake system component EfeO
MGFHRLEQILWNEPSMTGATALCQGLMDHEEKLVALVSKARYSPQEMAAGATDLINEAATSKITGEEERYSHTDLVDFDANMKASMKVAGLLSPYLRTVDPDLVSLLRQRNDAVQRPGPRGRRRARRRSRSTARTRPASSPPPRTGWRSAR